MSESNGTRPALHCIAYGDPGGGKSTFATTWPKPLLVFLFDAHGKDGPYLRWGRQVGATVETTQDEWGTPIRDIKAPNGDLIRLKYYNDISPVIGEDRQNYPRTYELFEWEMKSRTFFTEGWETVVVDSVTFMELAARMYAKFVKNPDSKEPRQWFAWSTDALELALIVQLQSFTRNLLVLAHIDANKDEVLGTFVRQLAAPGRLTGRNELAAGFAELYRAYVQRDKDGSDMYLLQTRRDTLFNCATQIEAPNPSWQEFESLWGGWT